MTGPFASRLFRIAFVLAGAYNLAFGAWAGFRPLEFFRLFEIDPPRYPEIWACLGMVVGVYGLLYWHAAWKLDTGWPIIAIGLLGKVLGPIGMVITFSEGWPRRLGMLCVYNDLIWWLPFGLFLARGSRVAGMLERLAPWCCAVLHAAALAAMALFLQAGMLTVPDVTRRATYVGEHAPTWTFGWSLWMASAASLVGFYAWWGCRLPAPRAATIGVVLAALGVVFDLSGESLSALVLVEQAMSLVGQSAGISWNSSGYESIERTATLLTAGAANTLYTLGGLVLMLSTRDLPRFVQFAMWTTWLAGLGMTVGAIVDSVPAMVATTTILFPLLVAWTMWMALRWRPV